MSRNPEKTSKTSPILQFMGIKNEGGVRAGEFVFNGPGLLQHARKNGFELPQETIEILERINWGVGADLEGTSSLDDIDEDFIKDLAELAEEDLTEAESWQ